MEHLPKSPIMAQIEMIHQVQSLLVPDSKFVVNLTEIEELEKITENAFDNAEFFIALESLKKVAKNTSTLLETIENAIDIAKERICPFCGGSGDADNSNNDNPPICTQCNGSGLL